MLKNPIPKNRNDKVDYIICDLCGSTDEDLISRGHRRVKGRLLEETEYLCYKCWKAHERQEYSDKLKKYRSDYYTRNKDYIDSKNRAFAATPKGVYTRLISRAKKRSLLNPITYEQYLSIIAQPCNYCGEPNGSMGVDRANNSEGYTLKNSRSCCSSCNYIKRDLLSEDQAKVFIRSVVEFRTSGTKPSRIDYPLIHESTVKSRNRSKWEYWYLTHDPKGSPRPGVSITEEEYREFRYVVNGNKCSYCTGSLPSGSYCLDQITPSKGYSLDNVRTACSVCNELKFNHLTAEEAEAGIRALQHYLSTTQTCYWYKRSKPNYNPETVRRWESKRRENWDSKVKWLLAHGWKVVETFEEFDAHRKHTKDLKIQCVGCDNIIGWDYSWRGDLEDCRTCIK